MFITFVQRLEELLDGVNGRVLQWVRVVPVAVEVLAEQVPLAVAQVDAVGIDDGDDLEDDVLAEVLRDLIVGGHEVDEPLNARGIFLISPSNFYMEIGFVVSTLFGINIRLVNPTRAQPLRT